MSAVGTRAAVARVLAGLNDEERAAAERRLGRVLTHRTAQQRFPTPGHLDQFARPENIQTPMLDLLDGAIVRAFAGEAPRWLFNCPPQEGKTTRLQAAAAWMLLHDPRLRIGFASYEQGIAAQSGLAVRQMIETHGSGYRGQRADPDHVDSLGLLLDPDRAMQTSWTLADVPGRKGVRPGGVISVGVGSALTGRPLDVLIVDDPLKDARAADSLVHRENVKNWFQSVASTRLAGRSIVIVIQTRWHEDDLTGWLLKEDALRSAPQYRHLNIAAQAEADDPLGREPGEWLTSARERSAEEWQRKREDVGTRWWFALYQGDPSPPEGGIFHRAWFDKHRVAELPRLVHKAVYVDPADNDGDGDEAGIVVSGVDATGNVYLLEDASDHYTVGGWVRAALFAMLRWDASRLAYEQSLSGLRRAIRTEWRIIRRDALALRAALPGDWPRGPDPEALSAALEARLDADHTDDERTDARTRLSALWPYVPAVLNLPETGPPVRRLPARGSKTVRAELVSPLFENGRARIYRHLPELERQMRTWRATQDSPDRMDAAVHAVDDMSANGASGTVHRPTGGNLATRSTAMPQIMRSTRRGR